jgi:multiple sugar transport system ATP-binding protein
MEMTSTPENNTQVVLKNISKHFKNVRAVDNVSLEAAKGEFLVLVGPSGCGKSTLLRIVAGLEVADAGEVWIGGRQVNDVSPKDRDIAMVFQNYALYPHMSVYDNLAFGLRMRKMPEQEIRQRVEAAADILGLREMLKRRPKQLSGGQHQRVALGRAIVRNPQVFLMDEPLSNLDAQLRVQMRAELIKLHRQLGVTTIYVTHDQTEAMTMGQRIAVLRDGLLQQIDTPLQIYQHPANKFVAGFVGSPAMNFLPMLIQKQAGILYLEGANLNLLLPPAASAKLTEYINRKVVLGIRPSDIHLATEKDAQQVALKVDVVETTGETIQVHLLTDTYNLLAELPAETHITAGEKVTVSFDMVKAHLFDPETENALL